jgi:uncharacterized protein (DUF2141 family)
MRFLWFTLILITAGCANVKPPAGGKKDIIPPKLLKTIPTDKGKNFKGQTIEFHFDEYLANEFIDDKIIITPFLKTAPKVSVNKNTIKLELKENLQADKTYTVNLTSAVKDFSEKNIASNIKLTFSTGDIIDSLSVKGNTFALLTKDTVPETLVSLYSVEDTFTILNNKPVYISKTDKNGNFNLENIKPGKYRIYALNEKNGNYIYDDPDEFVGFLPEPIDVGTNISGLQIPLLKFNYKPITIVNSTYSRKALLLQFNKGIKEFKTIDNNPNFIIRNNAREITLFNIPLKGDSVSTRIFAKDSFNLELSTQVGKSINKRDKNDTLPDKYLNITTIPSNNTEVDKTDEFYIIFDKTVTKLDSSKFRLIVDGNKKIPLPAIKLQTKTNSSFSFIPGLELKDSLVITIDSAAAVSSTGGTNNKYKFLFTPKKSENYGTISGTVSPGKEGSYIVQLYNANGVVFREYFNPTSFLFDNVPPGTYRLRVVIDSNKNKKWDRGDLKTNIPAENIIHYLPDIYLKANWEFPNIIIDLNNSE